MSYAECVDYLKSHSWQFTLLDTTSSVRVSANFLRSCLHYMDDPPDKKQLEGGVRGVG